MEIVGPPPFNRQNLYFGVLRCSRQVVVVVGTFLGGVRLPATVDVIFLLATRSDRECISCFGESCVFEYWKKEKCLVFSGKKVGKMDGPLKT